jgi:hypothetical protein
VVLITGQRCDNKSGICQSSDVSCTTAFRHSPQASEYRVHKSVAAGAVKQSHWHHYHWTEIPAARAPLVSPEKADWSSFTSPLSFTEQGDSDSRIPASPTSSHLRHTATATHAMRLAALSPGGALRKRLRPSTCREERDKEKRRKGEERCFLIINAHANFNHMGVSR